MSAVTAVPADAASLAGAPPVALVPQPTGWRGKLATLPLPALLTLLVGTLALVALAVGVLLRTGTSDNYKVLFAGLSDKDGGSVIAQLSQMNVPYRHAEHGNAILVPAEQVHEVRMKLGLMGLPKATTGGYELLDTPRFGQTQAGENVSIKRATEGELMRTIGSLSAVENARVLLALPNQNGFFREQQKPSASVVVQLRAGRTLDRAQLAGIVHLVSSSVPELAPRAVSVVDGNGTLLTEKDGDARGMDEQQMEYVRNVETTLQRRVVELLEPVVGRENLRASVTADVDFSEQLQVSEEYKPNTGKEPGSIRAQQTLEANQPGNGVPSGIPGAVSNTPPTPASAPVTGTAQQLQAANGIGGTNGGLGNALRREALTQYEVDKTQRTTRQAAGAIRRLSAAVVVNYRSTDVKGKTMTSALPAEEIDKLTQLVQQGIGFVADRGDTVRVINAPFKVPAPQAVEATPLWQQPWVQETARSWAVPVLVALLALTIVLTMIRPSIRTLMAPPPPPQIGAQLDTVVDDEPGAGEPVLDSALLLDQSKPNPRLEQARDLARQNPAAMANIVRSMINGVNQTGEVV